jgi:hypothetical protein
MMIRVNLPYLELGTAKARNFFHFSSTMGPMLIWQITRVELYCILFVTSNEGNESDDEIVQLLINTRGPTLTWQPKIVTALRCIVLVKTSTS